MLRRKELDDWLLGIRALTSKLTGKPLGAVTIRNLVAGVRAALTKFAEWEWWTPPLLWEKAFKGYSIKKLQTPAERKLRRKRPPMHSVDEKRILWHLALPFDQAMMALADWAGHTQTEIATLTFDEIKEVGADTFIDRDRHKTGIRGRWWIPPEPAAAIRKVVMAFLTPQNVPLVHRACKNKRARSDYSTSYDWLVVGGGRAKYKGVGTINGQGSYGFMLTAVDGKDGQPDQFRIKIWDQLSGAVVYDDQMGKDDDGYDATAIGGGSIIVHTK